jgi:hypothetical protein
MNSTVRIVLGVIIGIIVGGAVNMGIVMVGPAIIPPPAGVDMTTAEGLKAGIAMLEPKHFVAPFVAHALGTFVSALVAGLIAARHQITIGLALGALTLVGGIAAAMMIPAPTWFIVLDLVAAYIPMGWLGGKLATRKAA